MDDYEKKIFDETQAYIQEVSEANSKRAAAERAKFEYETANERVVAKSKSLRLHCGANIPTIYVKIGSGIVVITKYSIKQEKTIGS